VVVSVLAGMLALLIIAGVVLYFAAQSVVTSNETAPDTAGRTPASYFRPGDCIKDIPKTAQNVTLVDCDEAHRAEVIAVFMLPEGEFPGEAAVEEYKSRCEPELADYAPTAVDDPAVAVLKRFPDEASWGIGDRSVTCIAAFETPRTGALRR
jgi:Septum formation